MSYRRLTQVTRPQGVPHGAFTRRGPRPWRSLVDSCFRSCATTLPTPVALSKSTVSDRALADE